MKAAFLNMFTDRRFRLLRFWSNEYIRKLAPYFSGGVINISGWDDRDKEGGYYKDYFKNASSYTISNYSGKRGMAGLENEIYLDLTKDLPHELINSFDVCFNHTTLEHIFDVRRAFHNICEISRDIVFIIVPFSQTQHETTSFKDFWRFTPSCLRGMYSEEGMEVVFEAQSPFKRSSIYLLFIGSRYPDKWSRILPPFNEITEAGSWIGNNKITNIISSVFRRL